MFPILRSVETTQRTKDFVHLAKVWAEAKGSLSSARLIQEQRRYNPQVERILEKAKPGSAFGVG
jgi:hypothetical protein